MLELWLAVSSACTSFYDVYHSSPAYSTECRQVVEISTFAPTPKLGVTVYRGIQNVYRPYKPKHKWSDTLYPCQDLKTREAYIPCDWDQICTICGKRRRKVTTEEWREEGQ